jgi:O-antigen/teichoic acid export membrane protein
MRSQSSLAKDSSIIFLSLAFAGVISVLISLVAARNLGVAEFGVYSVVVSLQAFVGVFAGFNMNLALSKFVAERRKKDTRVAEGIAKTGLMLVLVLSVVSCLTYVALSGAIGHGFYKSSLVTQLIPFSALAVASGALFSTTFGVLRGYQEVRLAALMQMASPLCSLLIILPLIGPYGAESIFIGVVMGQTLVTISTVAVLGRNGIHVVSAELRLEECKMYRKELLAFALPVVISSFVILGTFLLGNSLLAVSQSFSSVGIFAVAFVFFQSFGIIPQSIVIMLVPRLAELASLSKETFVRERTSSIESGCILFFPLCLGIGLYAGPIIDFAYGSSYVGAGPVVLLMMIAGYFFAIAFLVEGVIESVGRTKVVLLLTLVWAVAFTAIASLLVGPWGARGLAAAFAGSYAIRAFSSFFVSTRLLSMDFKPAYGILLVSTFFAAMAVTLLSVQPDADYLTRGIPLVLGTAFVVWIGRDMMSSYFKVILSHLHGH